MTGTSTSDGAAGLTPLRSVDRVEYGEGSWTRRSAETTHHLRDLKTLFDAAAGSAAGPRRIRVCVVDTVLQTGGAEWFTTQLILASNPAVFEYIVVAWRLEEEHNALQERLKDAGIRVVSSTALNPSGQSYEDWKEQGLFDLLDHLSPDIVFFSSQYLPDELPQERLAQLPAVVRISNFHAEQMANSDFSAASQVICCTQEQFDAVPERFADRTTLISTGVNTELFAPVSAHQRAQLKREHGVPGRQVVLFVARLGDPLKRTPVFQEVVRKIKAARSDVTFMVVGYFESHQRENEAEWREFVERERILWREYVAPWEMPEIYKMADFLISTSAPHEGLSNTVLQALAAGVIPVVTQSAGMADLVTPGETGFLAEDGEALSVARALNQAADLDAEEREEYVANGRERIEEGFSLADSAAEYQKRFLELYRSGPARVCITDGYFGTGGAEWLAALLILTCDPKDLHFEIVVHEIKTPLVQWMRDQGVTVRETRGRATYSQWMRTGMADTFRRVRPDIVMPCTITTWPQHDPFYRLLIISQNASDAAVLEERHYEQADYILCVSEDVKNQLSADHQWKMSVLRNSIDLTMFREDAATKRRIREELGIAQEANVVLWCGRLHEPRKRMDVLQEVADAMRDDPSMHFVVMGYFRGDEGDRPGWTAFVESHPNVTWVDDVAPWETAGYYAAADIYLSTSGFKSSDFEGLSVATVQALATSLPVVTTMSGGQQEVVEDPVNGRLVPTGDADGLVAALREVAGADADTFAAMQRRSREKAEESFDIREHARLYTRLAHVLKGTVGAALLADPDLAPDRYGSTDAGDGDIERAKAASFIAYTWPIVPDADGAADEADEAVRLADGVAAIEAAAARLQPGARLAVRGVGPDLRNGSTGHYAAAQIQGLLDYLNRSFALWSSAERSGSDLVLQKR